MTTPSSFGPTDHFGVGLSTGVNNNLLFFGKIVGDNQFQVGNGGFSSGPGNLLIQPGTTYHLIGAYSMNPGVDPDLTMLWINPDPLDYFNNVSFATSADAWHDAFVAFHAANLTIFGNLSDIRFDNVVISNTAAGVGLNSSAVPEPQVSGMFAAVLIACGLVTNRSQAR
jgi:hypothetical protein